MLARITADVVLLTHLAFIVFAVFGGLLVIRKAWIAWLHVPAMLWAVWVVAAHRECPLTAIENHFLHAAGQSGYDGGFIEHYLLPLIYPPGLTESQQTVIAGLLGIWSVAVYVVAYRRRRRD